MRKLTGSMPHTKARPPKLTRAKDPIGPQKRGASLAVIVSVDDVNHPRYAVVSIQDHFPFEGGYALPMGCGPFTEGVAPGQPNNVNTISNQSIGTTGIRVTITPQANGGYTGMNNIIDGTEITYDATGTGVPGLGAHNVPENLTVSNCTSTTFDITNNYVHDNPNVSIIDAGAPMGYFYFYNNTSGVGGSICYVDKDTRQVTGFTGDTSAVAPSPYYQQVTGHKHNGNYDPRGFQNPGPIDLGYPEVTGNLPYNNSPVVLYGVVSSNGNIIGTAFAPGFLALIPPIPVGPYSGMYQALVTPVEDIYGFELVSSQWVWVQWSMKIDGALPSLGPCFTDTNVPDAGNCIFARFELTGSGGSQTFGKIQYGSSGGGGWSFGDVTQGAFLPVGVANGPTINDSGKKTHMVDVGLQYLSTTVFRIIVRCDNILMQDITINTTNMPGFNMGVPVYPGWLTDTTSDANHVYFKGYSFRTGPTHHGNGMPNTIAPILHNSPTFLTDQYTGEGVTTFDEEATFDLGGQVGPPVIPENYGYDPLMGDWGGTIVLLGKQTGGSNWATYGSLNPIIWNGRSPSTRPKYTGVWSGLGLGTQHGWDLGIMYQDIAGNQSAPTTLISGIDGTPISVKGLILNDNMITPALYPTGDAHQPTATNGDVPTQDASDVLATVYLNPALITGTPGGLPQPANVDYMSLVFFYRVYRATGPKNPWTTAGAIPLLLDGSNDYKLGPSNPYQFIYVQLKNEVEYDFAVDYMGASGYGPIQTTPLIASDFTNQPTIVHGPYKDKGVIVPPPNVTAYSDGNILSDNTLTAAAQLDFTVNNQPTDGTLSRIGVWMVRVDLNPKKPGQTGRFSKLKFEAEMLADGGGATQEYITDVVNLANGTIYIFYATYISNRGKETALPTQFTFCKTNITNPGAFDIMVDNDAGIAHTGTTHITIFDPTKFPQNAEDVAVTWVSANKLHGTFANTHDVPSIVCASTDQGFCGNLIAQDITLPGGYIPTMPKDMNCNVTDIDGHNNGDPGFNPYTGYTGGGQGQFNAEFSIQPHLSGGTPVYQTDPFSTTQSGGGTIGGWGVGWGVFALRRDSGKLDKTVSIHKYHLTTQIATEGWSNGSQINGTTDGLDVNAQWQIAISPYDQRNQFGVGPGDTPLAVFSALTAPLGAASINLIPDSSFHFVKGGYAGGRSTEAIYWVTYGMIAGTSHFYLTDQAQRRQGINNFVITDGLKDYKALSEPMKMIGGVVYNFSAYIDATGATDVGHGSPSISLISHETGPTLSSTAHKLDTSLHVNSPNASVLQAGDFITVGNDQYAENAHIGGSYTSGATTVPLAKPLNYTHLSGQTVFKCYDPSADNDSSLTLSEVHQVAGGVGVVQNTIEVWNDALVSVMFRSHKCSVSGQPIMFSVPMFTASEFREPYKDGPITKQKNPPGGHSPNWDLPTGPADNTQPVEISGGGYIDHLALSPQVQYHINQDGTGNQGQHNKLPNPDFIIGGGVTGIDGVHATGTAPLYYSAYNNLDACVFSYNSSAGCPVGNGGAWQLTYTHNTDGFKGLIIGPFNGYGGFKLKANSTYTFSAYVSQSIISTVDYPGTWNIGFNGSNQPTALVFSSSFGVNNIATQVYTSDTLWYRVIFTITTGANAYTNNIYIYNSYDPVGTSQTCYIGALKLENGGVPTTWQGAIYESGITDFVLPHPNKIIDNIPDGTLYGKVKNTELQGGSGGAGTVKQLNDGTNVRNALAVATNMDSSGNSKLHEFSNNAGIVETTDGTWIGFAASPGSSSSTVYSFPSSGAWVYCETNFKCNTTSIATFLVVGNNTNGYGITWNAADNTIRLTKWIAGVRTNLVTVATVTQDTNTHMYRLLVKAGATVNTIEGAFDNNSAIITDNVAGGLTLTSGTWAVTIQDGSAGGTKFWHFDVESSVDLYNKLPNPVLNTVLPAGGIDFSSGLHTNKNLDNIADGSTRSGILNTELSGSAGSRTIKQLNDGITTRTAAQLSTAVNSSGQVLVANSTGLLPYINTSATITSAIDSSSRIIGNIYDGATSISPANITNAINTSGQVKVANAIGLLPYLNLPAVITNVIDASSDLLISAFGISSGVKQSGTSGALTGFSGNVSTNSTYQLSASPVTISADIQLSATGHTCGLYFGNTTNGFGIEWVTGTGVVVTVQYVASVRTVLETIGTVTQDTNFHTFILCAQYNSGGGFNGVAGQFDNISSPFNGLGVNTAGLGLSSGVITVNAGTTTGNVQNLTIEYQNNLYHQFISCAPISNVLNNVGDANGSYVGHGIIYADQIHWSSGTPTGAVSLDSVPDGATYGKVKLADLTAGHVEKTGATGTFTIKGVGDTNTLNLDSEIVDGSTYARVNLTNLTNNNVNNQFNNVQCYYLNDGSIHFPGSAQTTGASYPIVASFPLTASGWIIPGSTANAVNMVIGNETNGLGIRWTAAGLVELVTYKAGSATTGASFVTVTRDANYHWFSIKLTPGATPGSSDAYVLWFDNNTSSGTTGATAITWSSTAGVTMDLGVAGGKLLNFRVGSNNP